MSERRKFPSLYKVRVPPGKSGRWEVREFEVSTAEAQLDFMRSLSGRSVPPGRYTGLYRGGKVIMSDTPAEIRDHLKFIRQAHGSVLVHGLGLGMVAVACMRKAQPVDSLTIVDKSSDVIRLAAPTVEAEARVHGVRLEIIQGDCYEWKPPKGRRWDFAWHDVWDELCTDNLREMTKLHRRFAKRVDVQDSWGREFLRREQARQKRERDSPFHWRNWR